MIRDNKPKKDLEKTREVILYVLNKLPGITQEHLANILYFIDFDYYEKHEEQLMGLEYIKESS